MSDIAALERLEADALSAFQAAVAAGKLRHAAEEAEKLADQRLRDADAAVSRWLRDRREAQRAKIGVG